MMLHTEDYIKDMFNDPQNGDYTIKSDYKLKEGFEPLKDINLSNVTPLDALNMIYKWQNKLQERW